MLNGKGFELIPPKELPPEARDYLAYKESIVPDGAEVAAFTSVAPQNIYVPDLVLYRMFPESFIATRQERDLALYRAQELGELRAGFTSGRFYSDEFIRSILSWGLSTEEEAYVSSRITRASLFRDSDILPSLFQRLNLLRFTLDNGIHPNLDVALNYAKRLTFGEVLEPGNAALTLNIDELRSLFPTNRLAVIHGRFITPHLEHEEAIRQLSLVKVEDPEVKTVVIVSMDPNYHEDILGRSCELLRLTQLGRVQGVDAVLPCFPPKAVYARRVARDAEFEDALTAHEIRTHFEGFYDSLFEASGGYLHYNPDDPGSLRRIKEARAKRLGLELIPKDKPSRLSTTLMMRPIAQSYWKIRGASLARYGDALDTARKDLLLELIDHVLNYGDPNKDYSAYFRLYEGFGNS
jgi:hypothetical protein